MLRYFVNDIFPELAAAMLGGIVMIAYKRVRYGICTKKLRDFIGWPVDSSNIYFLFDKNLNQGIDVTNMFKGDIEATKIMLPLTNCHIDQKQAEEPSDYKTNTETIIFVILYRNSH